MTNLADRVQKWPNFFIVGVPRAGTTALHGYLRSVPDIYLPSLKEPRYFLARSATSDIYGRQAVGNEQSYLNLFSDSDAVALGEATPEYLYHIDVAKKIYEVIPTARILISLRNPITRAFSHYLLLKQRLDLNCSFQELLQTEYSLFKDRLQPSAFRSANVIGCGFYSEGVKTYLDLFGPKRVKILVFEQWTLDLLNTLNSIMEFLQVNYRFDRIPEIPWKNPSNVANNRMLAFASSKVNNPSSLIGKIYRRLPGLAKNLFQRYYQSKMSRAETSSDKQSIPTDAKAFLQDIYADDVRRLKEITKTNSLPWEDFQ
jgi:hypothetical protein